MPRKLTVDHDSFRDLVNSRIGKELSDIIKKGKIFSTRSRNNTIPNFKLSIPQIFPQMDIREITPVVEKLRKYRSIFDDWEETAAWSNGTTLSS